MEPVSTKVRLHLGLSTLILIGVLSAGTGCTTMRMSSILPGHPAAKTEKSNSQVLATWSPKAVLAPDPLKGGATTTGLMGRVYIRDSVTDQLLEYEGSLIVDMYDHTSRGPNTEPVMLEQWRIDPETLKRLSKRDMFGPGWSVFLPWSSHRPDIQRIYLAVRFEPSNGSPAMLHQSGILTVDHSELKTK